MSDETPLFRLPAVALLERVVNADIARALGRALEKSEALEALAARCELADRLARSRWLALEQARAARRGGRASLTSRVGLGRL